MNWKKAVKQALAVLVIMFVAILALAGILMVSNVGNLGQLITVITYIQGKYVDDVSLSQLVDGAMAGMAATLDPYSSYQNEEESKALLESVQGKIGGIGVLISTVDTTKMLVTKAIRNSPAERAGLETGDVIIGVDDQDVTGMQQDEAIAILRGDPGTTVSVEVYREKNQDTFTVSLVREFVNVPTVEAEELPGHPEIAVVNISYFSKQTGNDFEQALEDIDMTNKKALILDLRYNYGGEVNAAIKTAGFLVPGQEIVHVTNKQGRHQVLTSSSPYLAKPLVVLVNSYSASAAEIVSGAVKDYESGVLVGTKTYGKGVMQTIFPLADDASLVLTTDRYLTPNRNDIHQKGIEPHVVVELTKGEKVTILPQSESFDTQMQEAVKIVLDMLK